MTGPSPPTRWDRWGIRRPRRSTLAETVITTALLVLIIAAFTMALAQVISTP